MNPNYILTGSLLLIPLALVVWMIVSARRNKKARLEREERLREIERTHREHQAELFRLQQERFGRPVRFADIVRATQAKGQSRRHDVGMHPGLGAPYGAGGNAPTHDSTGDAVRLAMLANQIDNGDLSHTPVEDEHRRHHHTPPADPVIESSAHDHSSHSHDSGSSDSGGGCDCGGGGSD